MGIRIDDSRRPIVLVTFDGPATDAEFQVYLDDMEAAVIGIDEISATILDASRAGTTSPTQRRKQADWIHRNAEVLRARSVGTAFVITSPIVRGMLTAILWISPMPVEHTVVATYAEAERWAIERLRARGVPVIARVA